jgi:hypothetical protein
MKMVDTFFGGDANVRKQLVHAVQAGMQNAHISSTQLDEICGFGNKEVGLPYKTEEFQADPSKLSGRAFGLATVALNINMDEILKPEFKNGVTLEMVVSQMKQDGVHVTAACGGGDVSTVKLDSQVPVYILLKVVEELD